MPDWLVEQPHCLLAPGVDLEYRLVGLSQSLAHVRPTQLRSIGQDADARLRGIAVAEHDRVVNDGLEVAMQRRLAIPRKRNHVRELSFALHETQDLFELG